MPCHSGGVNRSAANGRGGQRLRDELWLPKTPNAPESLEFLDSPMQYRRHA